MSEEECGASAQAENAWKSLIVVIYAADTGVQPKSVNKG
jgi:hypothetical protein